MQYIAVTVVAISITIWVVYKLANKLLGLQLRLKPLVLCALFAVLLSIVLPRFVVGFAGLVGTIGVLAFFAVIFAYFVAYYDETQEPELSGATAASTMSASTPVVSIASVEKEDLGQETSVFPSSLMLNSLVDHEPIATIECNPCDTSVFAVSEEDKVKQLPEFISSEEMIPKASSADMAIIEGQDATLSALVIEKPPVVTSEVIVEEIALCSEQDVFTLEPIEKETTKGNALCSAEISVDANPVAAPPIEEFDSQNILAFNTAANVETAASLKNDADNSENLDKMTEKQSQNEEFILPDSLDDLLELAFQYKEAKDFSSALKYFRDALDNFPESEAAPYLVVEVANILKNRGSYDEAIKAFTEGRNLPGLHSDQLLIQEFTDTIAYLRIVRNKLLERRLGFIPYHKIPADVCQDIDMEFREWRNLA